MNEAERTRLSKFLSLILRHRPELVGIRLDGRGWAEIGELVRRCIDFGQPLSEASLGEIVRNCPKGRFVISQDGLKIRAAQGHSIDVDLGWDSRTPPRLLFHGTVAKKLEGIRERGLERMGRHHVHLSGDREAAVEVGGRRGRPIVLVVRAGEMAAEGYEFFVAENGVWLTGHVPAKYIEFPD